MQFKSPTKRIVIIGFGAIGRQVLHCLQTSLYPQGIYAIFTRSNTVIEHNSLVHINRLSTLEQLNAWKPDLVVECAGQESVSTAVLQSLQHGADVICASIGALADKDLRRRLDLAMQEGDSRLITISGAIGGLDALDAARGAGLDSVIYTGRKPLNAWRNTQAALDFDLTQMFDATVIFEGNAGDAARLYPKNANATAAVALAGLGFEATHVRLVADPNIEHNIHEIDAVGDFGRFSIRLENKPLPDNPKTSWLAALSIEAELRRYLNVPFVAVTKVIR